MDPITDVFTSMRVESVVYGRFEATAPWGFACDGGEHAMFATVVRGNCWLSVRGLDKPIPLAGGDCILLPRGHAHTLRDHPRSATKPITEVVGAETLATGGLVQCGGGGAPTTLIAGVFRFDRITSKPLLDLLPPVIHLRGDQPHTAALQTTLQLLAAESGSEAIGSQVVMTRLADVFFIQALRAHCGSQNCCKKGWLRALSDPQIGTALRAMHDKIDQAWTVESLASIARMSRSAFALRFKEAVGEAPLEYLTRWRMYKATRLLRDGDRKLLEVANAIGYDSDGAFNRAFKRVLGVAPGEYRRAQMQPVRPPTAAAAVPVWQN
jgi:AraC-like DNA-binding protein